MRQHPLQERKLDFERVLLLVRGSRANEEPVVSEQRWSIRDAHATEWRLESISLSQRNPTKRHTVAWTHEQHTLDAQSAQLRECVAGNRSRIAITSMRTDQRA